jgi:hypothetical protein
MKITKSQLKQIIKEEIEEILPRSEAAAKTYDELAAQIAEMILAHDKGLFGEAGGMDRGALLYVLEQAEKKYNELAAQEREEKNESVRITRRQLKRIIREAIDPAELEAWAGNALTNDPELQAKEVNHNSLEVDGIDHSDYPDYSDAYFSYGEYVDGIEMNDDELNKLGMENPDLLYDTVQEFI